MRHTPRPHIAPPEPDSVWEDEDLARVDWDGAVLERVTFTDCRFDDAQLAELVTRRCVFERCVLTGVAMAGSAHDG
jgi:fluoroquinolone resistance protein